jgi:hypothetical protein
MSQDPEDTKPKLNLNIIYEGTREHASNGQVHDVVLILVRNVGNVRYHGESQSKHEVR